MHTNDLLGKMVFFLSHDDGSENHGIVTDASIIVSEDNGIRVQMEVRAEDGEHLTVFGNEITNIWNDR